jgi:hypothetical protein
MGGPLNQFRDARLQFLRNILQKIKQHAEDIGFDGTMQVSIIEVEPQSMDGEPNERANNGIVMGGDQWSPPRHPIMPQQQSQTPVAQFPSLPHFFPHPRPLVDELKARVKSLIPIFAILILITFL